jgi:hypothetical protein
VLKNSILGVRTRRLSFRNPPEADVRNPEKTIPYWIPDLGFASSGMTIVVFSDFLGSLLDAISK